jgi:hypothetical protein
VFRESKQRLGGDAAGKLRRPVESAGGDAGGLGPQRHSDGTLTVPIGTPPIGGGSADRVAVALDLLDEASSARSQGMC